MAGSLIPRGLIRSETCPRKRDLLDVTKKSLYLGIEQAVIGNRIGDISHAIQTYAESQNLSVVRHFVGHAIGENMHEEPQVPHYGRPTAGRVLKRAWSLPLNRC